MTAPTATSQPTKAPSGPMTDISTLITNARLIDPEAGTTREGAVLLTGGRIAEVFDTPAPEVSPALS